MNENKQEKKEKIKGIFSKLFFFFFFFFFLLTRSFFQVLVTYLFIALIKKLTIKHNIPTDHFYHFNQTLCCTNTITNTTEALCIFFLSSPKTSSQGQILQSVHTSETQ